MLLLVVVMVMLPFAATDCCQPPILIRHTRAILSDHTPKRMRVSNTTYIQAQTAVTLYAACSCSSSPTTSWANHFARTPTTHRHKLIVWLANRLWTLVCRWWLDLLLAYLVKCVKLSLSHTHTHNKRCNSTFVPSVQLPCLIYN